MDRRSALKAAVVLHALLCFSWPALALDSAVVRGAGVRVEFDAAMRTRIVARVAGRDEVLGPFAATETLLTTGRELRRCVLEHAAEEPITDVFGAGRRVAVSGRCGPLRKTVFVDVYDEWPRWALFTVRYKNEGATPVVLRGWTSNAYVFAPRPGDREPAFWSYQSGSYERRPDWVLPLGRGFDRSDNLPWA